MREPIAAAAESAVEFFPSLTELSLVRHGFVGRVPGIDVATDRAEALNRLDAAHRTFRANLGFAADSFATAEQIHGGEVAVIDQPLSGERCFDGADGLITNQVGVSLGIYVADCCAIFLVDPVRHCLGLVHSGGRGPSWRSSNGRSEPCTSNLDPCHAILSPNSAPAFVRRITR